MKESTKISLLKADLQLKNDLKALEESGRWGEMRKLLDQVPIKRMENAVQYLESIIIPAVEKRNGKDSADAKFFIDLVNLLCWAAICHDRLRGISSLYATQRLDMELLRERVLLYEAELSKYHALEDIWLGDALNHIEKGAAGRLENVLRRLEMVKKSK